MNIAKMAELYPRPRTEEEKEAARRKRAIVMADKTTYFPRKLAMANDILSRAKLLDR